MADIVYKVNQDSPENIAGVEQYSEKDKNLLTSFQVNNTFDPTKNFAELHILTLTDEIVESDYNYINYTQLGNAQSAGTAGASVLTIDPIADSKLYGYQNGGIKLLYHFLNDLYTQDITTVDFYIDSISPDRTELKLASTKLTSEEIVTYTTQVKQRLTSQSYFAGIRLNFKNNDLIIATNIDTLDSSQGKVIVLKLYEPLPTLYGFKDTLSIVEEISDSVAYEVETSIVTTPEPIPTLRPANFNIEVSDESVVPTGYFSYDELFSYPVNNTNSQVYSLFNEKGIEVSVDYTDYTDFVHFSSAQERLVNFKYKLDLINSYSASIATISSPSISGSVGITGSILYYEDLLSGVVKNFDHYERHLYYESGSTSWPKSNTTKPYNNKPSNAAESITWYANQNSIALGHDNTNYSSLVNSIPTYLREDENNANYLLFVYMIGQHFDNLWLYSKAVTDKYDADNRINRGISKDLVAEALKNFGVTLYTSNNSIQDLFSSIVGQTYQSGSEVISNYMTGSLAGTNTQIQPVGYDDYQKEVYKRVYHNLPLLLKSKGTERGLRALINCFGIPSDVLDIKLYGGRNTKERPFYGDYRYVTSSADKIRLDNTGSIIPGDTLTQTTSIQKRDNKYTDDLHRIEVGFSPTDNVDNYIISQSSSTFNIDQYLGDPGSLYEDNYEGLGDYAQTILGNLKQYNLQDYVRLIKFFDNVIFKMVKDFIPARSVADTGVIIKPNLLNRSKAKSVQVSTILIDYTGSIDTANISGSHGEAYLDRDASYTTNYATNVQTAGGLVLNRETFERPKYNGELANSGLTISDGNWNTQNTFKVTTYAPFTFDTYIVNTTEEICNLYNAPPQPKILTTKGSQNIGDLFSGFRQGTVYNYQYSTGEVVNAPTQPFQFTDSTRVGQIVNIGASHSGPPGQVCHATSSVYLAFCELDLVSAPPTLVSTLNPYNLNEFINIGTAQQQPNTLFPSTLPPPLRATVTIKKVVGGIPVPVNPQRVSGNTGEVEWILDFSNYADGDQLEIKVADYFYDPITLDSIPGTDCVRTVIVTVSGCTLTNPNPQGEYFDYSSNDYRGLITNYLALKATTSPYPYTRLSTQYSNGGQGVDSFFDGVVNIVNGPDAGNTKYTVYLIQQSATVGGQPIRALQVHRATIMTQAPGKAPGEVLKLETLTGYFSVGDQPYYEIIAETPQVGDPSGTYNCTQTVFVYPRIPTEYVCETPEYNGYGPVRASNCIAAPIQQNPDSPTNGPIGGGFGNTP